MPGTKRFEGLFLPAMLGALVLFPLAHGAWDQWAQSLAGILWGFWLLLAGALLWFGRRTESPWRLPIGPVAGALGLWTAGGWVSALASPFPFSAMPAVAADAVGALFFLLAAAAPSPWRLRLAGAVGGAAALAALPALTRGSDPAGVLVNANVLAGLLLLGLPVLVVLTARGRRFRYLWATAAAAAAFALLLTHSLTGFLVLMLEALWLLQAKIRGKRKWFWVALALVLTGAALWYGAEWKKLLGDPDRIGWWGAALAMWSSHSWFGLGPGTFGEAFPLYRTVEWGLNSLYAHNFLLELAAERGIVGLAAFGALIVAALGGASRAEDARERALGIGCAAFCLHALFNIGMSFPAVRWLFLAALGCLVPAREWRPSRGAGWIALPGMLLAVASWALFRADQSVARASAALDSGDNRRAEALIDRGIFWNARSPTLYAARARLRLSEGRPEAAAADMAKAMALAPAGAGFQRDAGELAALAGDLRTAIGHYDVAVHLVPLSAPNWERRGDLLAMAGRTDEAQDSYAMAEAALSDFRVLQGRAEQRAEIAGRLAQKRRSP